jgi:hypothetical protein
MIESEPPEKKCPLGSWFNLMLIRISPLSIINYREKETDGPGGDKSLLKHDSLVLN